MFLAKSGAPADEFDAPNADMMDLDFYGVLAALDVKDLACPTWGLGRVTSANGTVVTTIGPPYLPLIVPPNQALTLDPASAPDSLVASPINRGDFPADTKSPSPTDPVTPALETGNPPANSVLSSSTASDPSPRESPDPPPLHKALTQASPRHRDKSQPQAQRSRSDHIQRAGED